MFRRLHVSFYAGMHIIARALHVHVYMYAYTYTYIVHKM